jgi:hypothetical protein
MGCPPRRPRGRHGASHAVNVSRGDIVAACILEALAGGAAVGARSRWGQRDQGVYRDVA